MSKRAIVISRIFFILVLASKISFRTSREAHHLGAHPSASSPALLPSLPPTFPAR